jgi:hypothetical protein
MLYIALTLFEESDLSRVDVETGDRKAGLAEFDDEGEPDVAEPYDAYLRVS